MESDLVFPKCKILMTVMNSVILMNNIRVRDASSSQSHGNQE